MYNHVESVRYALLMKNWSMESEMIWPNITIGVNVFEEILVLTRVWHIVSSKKLNVQTTYIAISKTQM